VTDPKSAPRRPAAGAGAEESRAEQLLAQTLNVMAGGKSGAQSAATGAESRRRLTTGQLILLAAIIGLLIGIGLGFLSLLL
jgi:hypothetical protein